MVVNRNVAIVGEGKRGAVARGLEVVSRLCRAGRERIHVDLRHLRRDLVRRAVLLVAPDPGGSFLSSQCRITRSFDWVFALTGFFCDHRDLKPGRGLPPIV